MARAVDVAFYKGKRWQECRRAYLQAHPLCERCLAKVPEEIVPAKYVHHLTELNAENVNDARIAYGFDNLQALCFDCHEELHQRKVKRRYRVEPDGSIIIL